MGVDVAAPGSGVGSVVVVEEGDAWRPEWRLGAASKVDSLVESCPWLRRLKLHGKNHTKCTKFGPCKKIVFHRLCFLKTEY